MFAESRPGNGCCGKGVQQKQLLELGCWRELLATPPWGRKSPPSPSRGLRPCSQASTLQRMPKRAKSLAVSELESCIVAWVYPGPEEGWAAWCCARPYSFSWRALCRAPVMYTQSVSHGQHQEGARNWRDVERGGSPSLLCLVDHLLQIPYGCCSQRGQQLPQGLQGRAPWLPPPLPWILSAGSTNWLRALPSKQEPGRQAMLVVASLRICQICERRKMNGHKQQRKNMAVLSSKAPGVRG